jgi:putative transposase
LYDASISLALESVFLALGIHVEGQKESPGIWLAENACVDGLKGLSDAINAVYPESESICVVRNSLRFVSWRTTKPATRNLKTIDQTPEIQTLDTSPGRRG